MVFRRHLNKRDWKQDVVYLYQFPRSYYSPMISPFCLKLETWLRLAKLNYEIIESFPHHKKSPEGRLPYVEVNGVQYHDSQLIIEKLTDLFEKKDIDGWLSEEKQAVAHVLYVTIDVRAGAVGIYERFADHMNEMWGGDAMFAEDKIPWMLKNKLTRSLIQKKILARTSNFLGHSREDNFAMLLKDLKAASQILGDKKFYMGDQISTVDCCMFGMEAQIFSTPFVPKMKEYVKENCPNLEMHFNTMKDLLWSDWDQLIPARPIKPTKEEAKKEEKEKAEESKENGAAEKQENGEATEVKKEEPVAPAQVTVES